MPGNTLDMYTSDRVYDGKRPISAALAKKLRGRHVPPAKRSRLAFLVVPVIAVFSIAVQYLRVGHHG
jgi:hypothetical protein